MRRRYMPFWANNKYQVVNLEKLRAKFDQPQVVCPMCGKGGRLGVTLYRLDTEDGQAQYFCKEHKDKGGNHATV